MKVENSEKSQKSEHFRPFAPKNHRFRPLFVLKSCFWPVLFISASFSPLSSQKSIENNVDQVIRTIVEEFIESTGGEGQLDFNTLTEDLLLACQRKKNINAVTRDELAQLLFLTDPEITAIIKYRDNYGPLASLYELQVINGLSTDQIKLLLLFVRLDDTTPNQTSYEGLRDGKTDLFIKWRRIAETQQGFVPDANGDSKMTGNPDYLYMRLLHVATDIQYGMTVEKDVGEPFWNSTSPTRIDFVSGHYQWSKPTSWLNQLNVGDYTVQLGVGLIARNSFRLGKSAFSTSVKQGGKILRAYTSVAENIAFRGIAGDFSLDDRLSLLVFGSSSLRDANTVDGRNGLEFSSLQLSGLHRTTNEQEDQSSVRENTAGGSLRYDANNIHIGINGIHHHYSLPRQSNNTPSRLYNWSGNQLSNISFDFDALVSGYNLYGEVAYSSTDAIAMQYGLLKSLDRDFDIAIVYRDYSPRYQSIFGNSFGESQTITNEKGLYIGWEYRITNQWLLRGYVDHWKNPWVRFRVDGVGQGKEYMLRVDFSKKRNFNYYIQYRYEVKDENSQLSSDVDIPVPRHIHRLRLHRSFDVNSLLTIRSRIELSLYNKDQSISSGWLIYQDILWEPEESGMRLAGRLSYFNIDNFDSRIFAYENDLLYEYSAPAFWGEGLRYYLNLRFRWNRKLMSEIRIEQSRFFDRDVISSGITEIQDNTFTRVKAQIRYQF